MEKNKTNIMQCNGNKKKTSTTLCNITKKKTKMTWQNKMTKYQSANNIRNKNINQPDHGSINQPIINTLECEKGKKRYFAM